MSFGRPYKPASTRPAYGRVSSRSSLYSSPSPPSSSSSLASRSSLLGRPGPVRARARVPVKTTYDASYDPTVTSSYRPRRSRTPTRKSTTNSVKKVAKKSSSSLSSSSSSSRHRSASASGSSRRSSRSSARDVYGRRDEPLARTTASTGRSPARGEPNVMTTPSTSSSSRRRSSSARRDSSKSSRSRSSTTYEPREGVPRRGRSPRRSPSPSLRGSARDAVSTIATLNVSKSREGGVIPRARARPHTPTEPEVHGDQRVSLRLHGRWARWSTTPSSIVVQNEMVTVDRVIEPECSDRHVYMSTLQPAVASALDGYSSVVLYTPVLTRCDDVTKEGGGLLAHAVTDIFNHIAGPGRDNTWHVSVSVVMFEERYDGKCLDVTQDRRSRTQARVEDGDVFPHGTESPVVSSEHAMEVFEASRRAHPIHCSYLYRITIEQGIPGQSPIDTVRRGELLVLDVDSDFANSIFAVMPAAAAKEACTPERGLSHRFVHRLFASQEHLYRVHLVLALSTTATDGNALTVASLGQFVVEMFKISGVRRHPEDPSWRIVSLRDKLAHYLEMERKHSTAGTSRRRELARRQADQAEHLSMLESEVLRLSDEVDAFAASVGDQSRAHEDNDMAQEYATLRKAFEASPGLVYPHPLPDAPEVDGAAASGKGVDPSAVRAAAQELRVKVESLRDEYARLNRGTQLADLNAECIALKAEIKAANAKVDQVLSRREKLKQQLKLVKEEHSLYQSEVDDLEARLRAYASQPSSLSSSAAAASAAAPARANGQHHVDLYYE